MTVLIQGFIFAFSLMSFQGGFDPPSSTELLAGENVIVYDPPELIIEKAGTKCRGRTWKRKLRPDVDHPEPILGCGPRYPSRCGSHPGTAGAAELVFDVNPDGEPFNIRVVRTTHQCFNKAAAHSVAGERYPESENGFEDLKTFRVFQAAP